jgi:hypothetical protein
MEHDVESAAILLTSPIDIFRSNKPSLKRGRDCPPASGADFAQVTSIDIQIFRYAAVEYRRRLIELACLARLYLSPREQADCLLNSSNQLDADAYNICRALQFGHEIEVPKALYFEYKSPYDLCYLMTVEHIDVLIKTGFTTFDVHNPRNTSILARRLNLRAT